MLVCPCFEVQLFFQSQCCPCDAIAFLQDGTDLACENLLWCQAVQAFMVSICIVVVDEGVDLSFQVI